MLSALPGLNGKLIVDIPIIQEGKAYVFLQPNNFNKDKVNTHGILENNKVYALSGSKSTSGRFVVPADWTVSIAYVLGRKAGGMEVMTWVEEYADEDIELIIN